MAGGIAGLCTATLLHEAGVDVALVEAHDGGAHIDPVRFARGLAEQLGAEGVTVVEGVRVTGIDERPDGCTVHLDDGTTLAVARVVQTTHLPVSDPAFLAARVRPMRSYLVAGPAAAVPSGMYLAADAGWSLRPAPGPVCLVGGEGHAMTDHLSSEEHYQRLETLARTTFGVDVTHRWSAFDYEPVDGLPFIGRLSPGSSRRFVATGFRKWGMSNGMVAAAILTDALTGATHPQAQVFDSTCIVRTLGRQLAHNGLDVGIRFVKDRFTATLGTAEPEPGQGVVVRRGARTLAVSCDLDGTRRTVSATCTHLGCLVGFNDGDLTWDCPCHGSRFALDGSVLDGPATDPLAPADDLSAVDGA